ncbi:MAG: hypothetical protein AB7E47_00310 [Desulfovibrionaceae bacterium]
MKTINMAIILCLFIYLGTPLDVYGGNCEINLTCINTSRIIFEDSQMIHPETLEMIHNYMGIVFSDMKGEILNKMFRECLGKKLTIRAGDFILEQYVLRDSPISPLFLYVRDSESELRFVAQRICSDKVDQTLYRNEGIENYQTDGHATPVSPKGGE